MNRPPDFEVLRTALLGGRPDRVPLAELFFDIETMDRFMGREVNTVEDRVAFCVEAGYDYVPVCMPFFLFHLAPDREAQIAGSRKRREFRVRREAFTASAEEEGFFKSGREAVLSARKAAARGPGTDVSELGYRTGAPRPWIPAGYPWDGDLKDLSYLDLVASRLPAGMKAIVFENGIFEFFSMSMGMVNFCLGLYDDPEGMEFAFDEIGRRMVERYEAAARHPAVGAVWIADDIAGTDGLLWSPDAMRRLLFPHYRRIGDIARARGLPFIFHSDGNYMKVLPDLIEAGITSIQPIEPKAWHPMEIRRAYGNRLCLMGTIDLDLLTRGTPDEVRRLVRDHMATVGKDGAFCVGTSNTPAYYMKTENYRAMIDECNERGSASNQPDGMGKTTDVDQTSGLET